MPDSEESWRTLASSLALPVRYATGFRHVLLKDTACQFHRHPGIEIVYHPTGTGTTTTHSESRSRTWHFETGDVVIYPPFLEHNQRMTQDGMDECVALDWEGDDDAFPPLPLIVSARGNSYLSQELAALARTRAGVTESEAHCLSLRGAALLGNLLHASAGNATGTGADGGKAYVSRAKQLAGRALGSITTTADIADRLGISPDYLRHLFAEHEGTTFSQWLRRTKVEHAQDLLVRSTLPLKAIADDCGFASARHLCTTFKAYTGASPGRYRRQRQ